MDIEVTQNLMAAIIQKRKMEATRYDTKLQTIAEQHKKTLSICDKNQMSFLALTMIKRNEWWKKDKNIRDSLRKRLDIHLASAEKKKYEETDDDENGDGGGGRGGGLRHHQTNPNFEVISTENHMIILDQPSLVRERSFKGTPVLEPLQPQVALKSILKRQSSTDNTQTAAEANLTFVGPGQHQQPLPPIKNAPQKHVRSSIPNEDILQQPSSESTAPVLKDNTVTVAVPVVAAAEEQQNQEPVEPLYVELPEIFKQHQRRKQSLAKVAEVRLEEKEQLHTTFNRFYHRTPRYVESKPMFEEWRQKKRRTERSITKANELSQKKDQRYENLLNGLCGIKVLERDKPRLFLY
jgi:hypothetical protein